VCGDPGEGEECRVCGLDVVLCSCGDLEELDPECDPDTMEDDDLPYFWNL
jgi:hypothetical protein